ncbi:DNA polymerase [Mycena indigotica]|uniref:DNA polymerase n=1 Tax=Mycena indigotica TaxID=2126181 RepID=A0A8H6SFY2_9AGAR|nr:DNA polymerase [Mycena indigotica]KAF7298791.1 DNA polymerase [Mycena indigotica]
MQRLACGSRCRLSLPFRVYSTAGPNQAVLEMLRADKDEETQNPDKNPFKVRAFTSAINVISELDYPIQSADEVKSLKGVGPGILRRIREFLGETEPARKSGLSTKVDERAVQAVKKAQLARSELEQIPGIGVAKAKVLVEAGCTTIKQLQTTPRFLALLTKQQQIGVQYFRKLSRVSRSEAETVVQFIRDAVPPKYEVILGGSYRRGSQDSSDIDLIILHPDHVHVPFPQTAQKRGAPPKSARPLLKTNFLPPLTDRGLLAATLSAGDLKWQGIVRIPEAVTSNSDRSMQWQRRLAAIKAGEGSYRRLDINMVAQKSRGAALLAFTGDTEFNRQLRLRASKAGLHLNEFGLWRWNRNGDNIDTIESEPGNGNGFWELVRSDTEEEVLSELGMSYLPPEERNLAKVIKKPEPTTPNSSRRSRGRPKKAPSE